MRFQYYLTYFYAISRQHLTWPLPEEDRCINVVGQKLISLPVFILPDTVQPVSFPGGDGGVNSFIIFPSFGVCSKIKMTYRCHVIHCIIWMEVKSMKIDRMIGILSLLLQREKVTASELAEHFEVSKRTILRDIEWIELF